MSMRLIVLPLHVSCRWAAIAALIALVVADAVFAGNWSVLSRYWQPYHPYGAVGHMPCDDCLQPWQPIRSVMHPNVLPEGMHRPLPLRRPTPTLAPPTPLTYKPAFGARLHQMLWGHGG